MPRPLWSNRGDGGSATASTENLSTKQAPSLTNGVAYGATLLLGIGIIAVAAGFPSSGEAHSSPASFPFAVGILLIFLGLAGWFCGGSTDAEADDEPLPGSAETENPAANPRQTWFLAAVVTVYLFLMPALGFISTTALLGLGVLWVLGERSIPKALAIGFLFGFALYLVFGVVMNVPLPEGVIG